MAEIFLDTRAEQKQVVTPKDRELVLDAFSVYFREVFNEFQKNGKGLYTTLSAGVEMATGVKVVNPSRPIPASYQGDGSFPVSFDSIDGNRITQTEYIPWQWARDDWSREYFATLMKNSRPFRVGGSYYFDRVRLEAHHIASESLEPGKKHDEADDKWFFQIGEWRLRERREIVLPVVTVNPAA